ncbi:MAG: TatD family hydrolase [Lachnospira sp.]|nr:TatD family hydrolase [Lachnospira sp.]
MDLLWGGFHPNCVNQAVDDDDWHEQQLRELLSPTKVVVVRETGLDSSLVARRFFMDVSDENIKKLFNIG